MGWSHTASFVGKNPKKVLNWERESPSHTYASDLSAPSPTHSRNHSQVCESQQAAVMGYFCKLLLLLLRNNWNGWTAIYVWAAVDWLFKTSLCKLLPGNCKLLTGCSKLSASFCKQNLVSEPIAGKEFLNFRVSKGMTKKSAVFSKALFLQKCVFLWPKPRCSESSGAKKTLACFWVKSVRLEYQQWCVCVTDSCQLAQSSAQQEQDELSCGEI